MQYFVVGTFPHRAQFFSPNWNNIVHLWKNVKYGSYMIKQKGQFCCLIHLTSGMWILTLVIQHRSPLNAVHIEFFRSSSGFLKCTFLFRNFHCQHTTQFILKNGTHNGVNWDTLRSSEMTSYDEWEKMHNFTFYISHVFYNLYIFTLFIKYI